MEDNSPETLSPKDFERRFESIPLEISFIGFIDNYLSSLQENDVTGIKSSKKTLVDEMSRYTRDWQFIDDNQKGLGSGSIGEAISHMVGTGIFKDFPVMRKCKDKDHERNSIVVKKTPTNDIDNVVFDLSVIFYKGRDEYFAKYSIDTSKQQLNERLLQLERQRDILSRTKLMTT